MFTTALITFAEPYSCRSLTDKHYTLKDICLAAQLGKPFTVRSFRGIIGSFGCSTMLVILKLRGRLETVITNERFVVMGCLLRDCKIQEYARSTDSCSLL